MGKLGKLINCRGAIEKDLRVYAKSIGKADQVSHLLAKMQALVGVIGQESRNKPNLYALGMALLTDKPQVIEIGRAHV